MCDLVHLHDLDTHDPDDWNDGNLSARIINRVVACAVLQMPRLVRMADVPQAA